MLAGVRVLFPLGNTNSVRRSLCKQWAMKPREHVAVKRARGGLVCLALN